MRKILFKDAKIKTFYDDKTFDLYNYFENKVDIFGEFDHINLNNGDRYKFVQYDNDEFFSNKPFIGHQTLISNKFKADIKEALELLSDKFPEEYNFFKSYVNILWPVKKVADGSATEITSSIYPKITDTLFISRNANVHIPPLNINNTKSKYILAENLYHEAIHLFVNKLILNYKIMITDIVPMDYTFEMPWRRNSSKRNQFWEIDGILHAASVYSYLIDFRKNVIQLTKEYKNTNEFFINSVESAQICYTYLKEILLSNLTLFTEVGISSAKSIE